MAESKGFFRGCCLSRLALLVASVGKNSPPDCFLPKGCLSPSLFESLFIIKKQNHPKGWLCFLWRRARIFPRLPPLSPRFARCHRRQKQSTGLFFSERLCLSPSLFESLFIIKNKTTPKDGFVFYGGEQGIRTLEQVIARYTISNRAPSASSDNSPNILLDVLYIIKIKIASKNILCYNIFINNIGGTL